jgi:phosphoheptose isomerase
MPFPEQYRAELVNALKSIDLSAVEDTIKIFREARAHSRCIFVCGDGGNAAIASRLLCDMVRSSNVNRTMKFRIFALTGELSRVNASDELVHDHSLVNELRNVACPADVVVGIAVSGNSRCMLNVLEYANEIGCRTVCICGWAGGKLATISEKAILVPASHHGNVEDAHMIVCRMIGHYFVNFDHD